ncbi:hypothetical protein AMATHDRAFT_45348 [Amanita thiersii Skay4041]|uniref:Copper-fist domain-containing protein n=1 Tax=Amanita thiersii Skay4041 TaxID=703135 RepID=A0A2A9NZL2_9AGAR|nr:hypothetical protein AMATHDRAFT_45348 [Amanita thiersii Skay4041]
MSHILARVKELRPVLPRPASSNSSNGGPVHELSSGLPHSHPNRYHMHESVMFSPYERAHDRTHDHPLGHDKIFSTSPSTSHIPSPTGHSHPDHPPSSEASIPQPSVTQPGNMLFSGDLPNLSACNCGANCGCGDCVKPIQPPNTVPSPDSQCTNPNACTTCLECSFFRNFAPPSATSQPVLDANQRIAIDEWIRQVSSLKSGPDIPTFVSAFSPQEYPHLDEPTSQVTQVKNQPDLTSNSWHESLLAPSINIPPSNHSDEYRTYASTPERCANQCNCPPGSCICQREECVTVERSPIEPAAFAVSRERASCCASKLTQLQMIQGMSRSDTHLVLPDTYQSRPLSAPYGNAELYRQYVPNATELPFSASTSALDITRRPAYLNINGGQASAGQAYLDLPVPITNDQTSSLANYTLAWVAASNYDGTTAPVMPYYAISNPGTDGTSSSYDDLSMTLRTQL